MIRRVFDPSLYSSSFLLLLLLLLLILFRILGSILFIWQDLEFFFFFSFLIETRYIQMWNFLPRMNPRILIIVQVSQWNGFLRGIFKIILSESLRNRIRCVEIDTSLIFRVQFTCSNVLVSFLQFPCHCIWSIVQIILFVVISYIFNILLINWLLRERKRKIYHVSYHLY